MIFFFLPVFRIKNKVFSFLQWCLSRFGGGRGGGLLLFVFFCLSIIWLLEFFRYFMCFRPLQFLFLLMPNFGPVRGRGPLHVDSWILLIWPQWFSIVFLLLFSNKTKCFRITLYIFCPKPGINHFSKLFCFQNRFLSCISTTYLCIIYTYIHNYINVLIYKQLYTLLFIYLLW